MPENQDSTAISTLDALRAAGTTVVADTGDFGAIAKYKPQDSTTNPSLLLAAAQLPNYASLVETAVQYGKENGDTLEAKVECAVDRLIVEFGRKILEIVPGRVSTEIDARLSFDTKASVEKALTIIKLYEANGVSRDRVLIKIAATWEGIQAARILENQHGIHCNLTLLFSFCQAVACAEANVTLVSPFVARIQDYYKIAWNRDFTIDEHPGVKTVSRIYNYYKKFDYKTVVMGASLRTVEEIKALAGIDLFTLNLGLLDKLATTNEPVPRVLSPEKAKESKEEKISYIDNEPAYRLAFNDDAMATEKVSDGIRTFSADVNTLFKIIEEKITA